MIGAKMGKLKSCPFCGSNAKVIDMGSERYHVKCKTCPARFGATWGNNETVQELTVLWNTRHNSHNDMITFIAEYLQIDRHELGNLIQQLQYKAMKERGEIDAG